MQRQSVMGAALGVVLLLVAGAALPEEAATEAFDDGAIYQIQYPDWFKQSFLTLSEDAEMAADAGKQGLFLFFTTQGCSYCYLFIEKVLSDPALSARLREHFDSIGLEIFSDAELTDFAGDETRVKTFAVDQGVEFAPTLLFVDTHGTPLLRLTGYYGPERFSQVLDYLTTDAGADRSWPEYLASVRDDGDGADDGSGDGSGATASLPADPLFAEPPYMLDRSRFAGERPLMVLFEGVDCARCEQFHQQVLGDESIRERLDAFDVVRLDAADTRTPVLTPAGEQTSPADWYQSLRFTQLPALAFFNEDGERVQETDALVLQSRMNNLIGFVTDRAYERGWNYQRYARSQALEKASD
jgi:thioredoxin-related protein